MALHGLIGIRGCASVVTDEGDQRVNIEWFCDDGSHPL